MRARISSSGSRATLRLPEVQVLKRLLYTVRGISLELVDSPPAPGNDEEIEAQMAADDAAAALVLYQQLNFLKSNDLLGSVAVHNI